MKNQSFASNVIPSAAVLEKSTFLRQRTVVHTGKTGKGSSVTCPSMASKDGASFVRRELALRVYAVARQEAD
jgi:hypothetical protein